MMLSRRTLMAAALCAAISPAGLFAAEDPLALYEQSTKGASGRFVQTSRDRDGRVTLEASGSFAFLRPGRFDWVYEKPYRQRIVSDGSTLWFYDEDLMQATKKSLDSMLDAGPAALLFGGADALSGWSVREIEPENGRRRTEALPKTPGSIERAVVVWGADGAPVGMELTDAFGQRTTLVFEELVEGEPDASRFEFTPAEGVDVLDAAGSGSGAGGLR